MSNTLRIGIPLPEFLAEDSHGFVHVAGRRIGLDQIVHYYNAGYSAEMLACEFPSVSLSVIHRCIAFYLDHPTEVDQYEASCRSETESLRLAEGGGPSLSELRARLVRSQTVGTK